MSSSSSGSDYYSRKAREVIAEVVYEKFINFVRKYCKCTELREKNALYFQLKPILDELESCIINNVERNFRDVRTYTVKKLLRKETYLEVNGVIFKKQDALMLIDKARSFLRWYEDDCSLSTLISDFTRPNDLGVKDIIKSSIDKLNQLCKGVEVKFNVQNVQDYVINGIKKALNDYLKTRQFQR